MVDPITFGRVCGVTLKVADGSVTRTLDRVEDNGSTLVNRSINNRRGLRLTVSATTTPTTRARADALEGLLQGHAHRWSYDADFHSSRGKGPEAGLNALILSAAPAPKVGAGYAAIDELTYDLATADDVVELADRWMWHGWKLAADSVTWEDWQVRSDGAVWVDGERDDAADTGWLVIGFGSYSLTGVSVDDVALFLFEPDDEMAAELHAWHVDNAWPDFGNLLVDGEVLEGRTLTATGEVEEAAVVQFADPDGGWENAGRALRFTLRQVMTAPAFLVRLPRALIYTDPTELIRDHAGWYNAIKATVLNGPLTSKVSPFGVAATFGPGAQSIGLGTSVEARTKISIASPQTITAWVNVPGPAVSFSAIFGKVIFAAFAGPLFFLLDGGLGFAWFDTLGTAAILASSSQGIPIDRWVFVAMRYDGSNTAAGIELLVDGVAVPIDQVIDNPTAPPLTSAISPAIGTAADAVGDFPLVGSVDCVGVWNVRLTDAEIAELYRAGQRKRRPRFFPTGV